MKWPLVSRRAYDVVYEQVTWLRHRNDLLESTLARLKRVEMGLSETPREPREREGLPETLRHYIAGFSNRGTRMTLTDEVRKARAEGLGWDEIERRMRGEEVAATVD